jgi:hypothetical protein
MIKEDTPEENEEADYQYFLDNSEDVQERLRQFERRRFRKKGFFAEESVKALLPAWMIPEKDKEKYLSKELEYQESVLGEPEDQT